MISRDDRVARGIGSTRLRTGVSAVLKRLPVQRRRVMVCESCELTGGPFAPGEAALLLQVHMQLHHGAFTSHRMPLPPVRNPR